jgi:hypothetical protein
VNKRSSKGPKTPSQQKAKKRKKEKVGKKIGPEKLPKSAKMQNKPHSSFDRSTSNRREESKSTATKQRLA